MKTTLLFLLALILTSFTYPTSDWVEAKLSAQVSVKLPTLPELEKDKGVQGYRVFNGRTAFVASAIELSIPANQKVTPYDTRVILMGAEMGALKRAEGEVISKSDFKIGDTEGKELSFYTTDPTTGIKMINYMRMLIVGRKMYSFHCWHPQDNTEAVQDKDAFFNSITIAS